MNVKQGLNGKKGKITILSGIQNPTNGGYSSFGDKIILSGGCAGGYNKGEGGKVETNKFGIGGIAGKDGIWEGVVFGLAAEGRGAESVITDINAHGFGRGARRR